MSNIFANQSLLFVPLPRVVAEVWSEMSWAEQRLYVCLLLFAEKHSAAELHLPAFVISDYTKLHAETIPIARKALEQRGYIRSKKGFQGVTVYQVLNPISKHELPPLKQEKKQFSGVYVYKTAGRSARSKRNTPHIPQSPVLLPPSWNEIGQSNPSPQSSQSVSIPSPIRQDVTDQTDSSFSKATENKQVNDVQTATSEKALKKGILKKGQNKERDISNIETEKDGTDTQTRTMTGPLEHIAKDPIVAALHEMFDAKIVDVVDLRGGEQLKNPGMLPADYWRMKMFGRPAKAAPIMHRKFSERK